MIYQIYNTDVESALQQQAIIICWSYDGSYVLVQSSQGLSGIVILETYTDDQLMSLMKLELWQQPCPGC